MRLIRRPRQQGKTTEVLRAMVANPTMVYVASSYKRAMSAYELSMKHGLDLDQSRFIGPSLESSRTMPRDATIVLDDLDETLLALFQRPVRLVTWSDDS